MASYTHWDSLFDDVEFMIELLTRLSAYGHGAAPSFETIHTTPFLQHAALSFAASISSSDIEFTSYIAPELPDLVGDPTLLKEVLINLLKNASEAIDPEHKGDITGSIHLKAFMRCGKLHITISDSGCGIAPEQIDRIFDPFCQFQKRRLRNRTCNCKTNRQFAYGYTRSDFQYRIRNYLFGNSSGKKIWN